MNWQEKVIDLQRAGYSQKELAELCGCTQPFISDLKRGKKGLGLSFEIGSRIDNLWKKTKNEKRKLEAAACKP